MQIEQFITFITAHWQLALLFVVLLLLLVGLEVRNRLLGIPQLSPSEVTQAINHQAAILVDIRSKDSFAQGHILGSDNRPWKEFEAQISTVDFDKQKPVIVICENGQHAQKAALMLRKVGFLQANILKGGLPSWCSAGLPLIKKIIK